MIHADPSKRHEFVFLFDVENGNPNGDPDAGNLPRVDPQTMHGLVTDVALKRKVRDYVASVLGKDIFIQSKTALNTLYFRALQQTGVEPLKVTLEEDETLVEWLSSVEADDVEFNPETRELTYAGEENKKKGLLNVLKGELEVGKELGGKLDTLASELEKLAKKKVKPTPQKREQTKKLLWEEYYDIRMFGAVLTAGTNAGQVRGPVQFTFAKSVDPILPMDVPITRIAITKEADRTRKGKQTEMGRKAVVPYALYMARGFYNPFLAEDTGVSEEDLSTLWEATEHMFTFDHSAARGEMSPRGLYIFSHDDKKGNAHAHKLFELIKVSNSKNGEVPRGFDDYRSKIDTPVLKDDGGNEVASGKLTEYGFPEVTLTKLLEG